MGETLLEDYLASVLHYFSLAAGSTPRTPGMSWVDLASVVATRPQLPGSQALSDAFQREVGHPALGLLLSTLPLETRRTTGKQCWRWRLTHQSTCCLTWVYLLPVAHWVCWALRRSGKDSHSPPH